MFADATVLPSTDVSRFFKALSDDTRLAIVRLLALTDLRAGEVTEQLNAPQNAVSYHLKQLRSLGLLRDRRSGLDARDIYYSIDLERLHTLYLAAGSSLHPAITPAATEETEQGCGDRPLRVLFLCTHNSARSQLAEGITRHIGGDQVEVYSAGSIESKLHPLTVKLLEEWNINTSLHYSKPLDQFLGQQFDYVITTCDRMRETCPVFPGDPRRIHWSFPDPKQIEAPEERLRAFQTVRAELCTRIRYLLSLPHPGTGRRVRVRPTDSPGKHP